MIEQVRSYRFTIKQIFKEHWENYLSQHKDSLRQDIIWTVEKMFSCRDPQRLGYHKFACPEQPDQYIIIPLVLVKLASVTPVVKFLPISGWKE